MNDIYEILDFCYLSNSKDTLLLLTNNPKKLYRYNLINEQFESFPKKENDFMKLQPNSITHDSLFNKTYALGAGHLYELDNQYGIPKREYRVRASLLNMVIEGDTVVGYNNSAIAKPIFHGTLNQKTEEVEESWFDIELHDSDEMIAKEARNEIESKLANPSLVEIAMKTIKRTINFNYVAISDQGLFLIKKTTGDVRLLKEEKTSYLYNFNAILEEDSQAIDMVQQDNRIFLLVRDSHNYSALLELNRKAVILKKYVFTDARNGTPYRFLPAEEGQFLVLVYEPSEDRFGISRYKVNVSRFEKRDLLKERKSFQ